MGRGVGESGVVPLRDLPDSIKVSGWRVGAGFRVSGVWGFGLTLTLKNLPF